MSQIPARKVYIWQGAEDTTCRVDNAYRLAKSVPNACLEIFNHKGHCVMFDNLPKLSKALQPE
jgi:pimeloyl-ACP methyl ester carboxylesterase